MISIHEQLIYAIRQRAIGRLCSAVILLTDMECRSDILPSSSKRKSLLKAMVYHDYGPPDVLKCEEVEIPTPKENQVLRRVHSAAVNPLDCGLMKGKPHSMHFLFGFPKPKTTRPERDVLGQVEAVGRSVTRFKPGDVLFGACTAGNWMDKVDGLFAEYVCTLANALGTKPENITFEQTASAPIAALTAPMRFRDAALGCGAKTARISDPAYSGDSVAGSSRLGTRV